MERSNLYDGSKESGKPAIPGGIESRLFIVRVWNEDLGGGRSEWRAFVRCVPGGESRYVRTWDDLQTLLGDSPNRLNRKNRPPPEGEKSNG